MNRLRISLRIALIVFAAYAALNILMVATNEDGIDRSLAKGRGIHASFKNAARHIDEYLKSEGRLPTTQEMTKNAVGSQSGFDNPESLWITEAPFSSDIIEANGTPPPNGYVLGYWRGEWIEQYVSWTRKSSVALERSAYYLTGSQSLDLVLSSVALVVMSFFAFKLRRRKSVPNAA